MNAAANTSARAEARLAERVDAGELAVEARIVEAVADDEPVGDDKAGEVDLHVHLASGGSVEQRCHPQGRRLHAPETPQDRVDRSARVDDVLDEQYMPSLERAFDHVRDLHAPAGLRPRAVARRAHELELGRGRKAG